MRDRCPRAVAPIALILFASLPAFGPVGCSGAHQPSAEQQAQVEVVLYTTSWCRACDETRRWFRERQVAFEDHDVERDGAAAAAHRRLNPRGTVPTIELDGQVIVGFEESELSAALRRAALDH